MIFLRAVFETVFIFVIINTIVAAEDIANDTEVITEYARNDTEEDKTSFGWEDIRNDTEVIRDAGALGNARNATKDKKIIGGIITSPDEFKFVVGLWIKFQVGTTPTEMRCTGTAVDQYTVLTAGHCVSGFKTIIVYVNCYNAVECTNTRTGTGFIHPDYGRVRDITVNDVGVVKTSEALGTQEHTQLAQPKRQYASCTVVGYGAPSKEPITEDRFLYKLDVSDVEWCSSLYPEDDRFVNTLCAFVRDGRQLYHGVAGGPLLCEDMQVGVTSQVVPTREAIQRILIVWAMPSPHTNWIRATSSANSVDFDMSLGIVISIIIQREVYAILS